MITFGEWCWGTSFYHNGSHYGFLFFRCPTSFYNCVIELTKAEMKAAETFGPQMYKDLREARQDNPNYRVKVVSSGKKVDHHKGLTADRMKKFIHEVV